MRILFENITGNRKTVSMAFSFGCKSRIVDGFYGMGVVGKTIESFSEIEEFSGIN